MLRGSCLCGAVSFSVEGKLELAHACHCSMCRKVHGTAYGAYAAVQASGFRWTSGHDIVRSYRSSDTNQRRFCGRCGSVVPNPHAGRDTVGIPLGLLEGEVQDIRLLAHIFADSKAPWHEITDGVRSFADWPPGYDFPALPTPERGAPAAGAVEGSCLCGAVAYEVSPQPASMRNCHCSRCRKARSAPHATNALCNLASFRYTRGEALLHSWKLPEGQFFGQTFCGACGSPMPHRTPERDLVIIPAGSFDGDPRVRPHEHIFVGSKASWFDITDTLPQRNERT